MWNTLFAASFKHTLSDLDKNTDMAGLAVLTDMFCSFPSSAPGVHAHLALGTAGIRAQG